jgi:hypothetical protein
MELTDEEWNARMAAEEWEWRRMEEFWETRKEIQEQLKERDEP